MPFHVKTSGSWVQIEKFHVRASGSWREANVYVKTNGNWELVHSRVTFNHPEGNISDVGSPSASVTITASESVTWTWSSLIGDTTANRSNGSSGTSVTFTLFGAAKFGGASNVQANGYHTWSVDLSTF